MRWLLFLSRLAFITGLCFLASLSQLLWGWMHEGSVLSTIITIGIFMGLLILPVTCISYGLILIFRKKIRDVVPRWLIILNLVFLIFLLFTIFYWNDPYYHQR